MTPAPEHLQCEIETFRTHRVDETPGLVCLRLCGPHALHGRDLDDPVDRPGPPPQ